MALEARVGSLAKGMPAANSPTLTTVFSSSVVNCRPKMEETASTEGETDPRTEVSSTWDPLTKSWNCPLAVGKNPQGART